VRHSHKLVRRFAAVGIVTVTMLAAAHAAGATLSPKSVAAKLRQRFEQISDYQCVIKTETRAGTRVEAAQFRVWYRKPGLFRLRVLRGRHRGSELLVQADGTLRGRRGGLLRPFSRRLSRSDSSLRSLRGQPAWELDFGSFLRVMRQRMTQPGSTSTVREAEVGGPNLLLEVNYRPSAGSHPLRDVWIIDPRTWLLVGGDVFDGAQRVDHFEISDLKVDRGLPESFFHF
jgi:outer membrane lipoprotein-sorting protein